MSSRSIGQILACLLILGVTSRLLAAGNSQDQPSAAPAPQPDLPELRFSGEVTRGQPFARDVGHNLFFRLTPATSDEGGGWVIEMLPPYEQPGADPVEFSAIATPPYHAYNDRYIAAAFGYSAKEALQSPLRKFNFVLSADDEHRADEVVNAALYPSTVGEQERARVAAEAAAIMLGTGQLRITRSHVNSGRDGAPDVIASIKFAVVLNFSPSLTLQQVLAPHAPAPKR